MAGPSGKRFAWTWGPIIWAGPGPPLVPPKGLRSIVTGPGPRDKVGPGPKLVHFAHESGIITATFKSGKNSQKCRIRSQWRRHSLQNMPKVQDSAKWPSRRAGAGKSKGQAGKGIGERKATSLLNSSKCTRNSHNKFVFLSVCT